jgi:phosphohistidine phosphatase
MRLFLMQHGQAVGEEDNPARPLTEKGRADTKKMVQYAVDHADIHFTRIVHSGKLRARQTAEIWREHVPAVTIEQAEGMEPTASPEFWRRRLVREADDMLLVGHLPHLARLAALLLCGNEANEVIRFHNAGLVCLERSERGDWSIRWVLTPEIV